LEIRLDSGVIIAIPVPPGYQLLVRSLLLRTFFRDVTHLDILTPQHSTFDHLQPATPAAHTYQFGVGIEMGSKARVHHDHGWLRVGFGWASREVQFELDRELKWGAQASTELKVC
jgi:hypothetical protein